MKKLGLVVAVAVATMLGACGKEEGATPGAQVAPAAKADLALAHKEVSEPAWLRKRMPADAVAYFRIPSLWGALAAADGRPLDSLYASEANAKAIAQVRDTLAKDPVIAAAGIAPWVGLLAGAQRSPLEIAILDASKFATPASLVMIHGRFAYADAAAATAAIAALDPTIQVEKPIADGAVGTFALGGMKLFGHFDGKSQRLTLLAGMTANAAELEKRVAAFANEGEHPMQALEEGIDAGGQGLFVWTSIEAMRPMAATGMQGMPADAIPRKLVAQMRGAAFGSGSVNGRGVTSLRIDAPQANLLHYLPRTAKRVGFRSVGEPDWVVTLALWTPQEWAQVRAAIARDMGADAGKNIDDALAKMRTELGLGIEDLLGALGPEISFVSDAAGSYGAARIADPDALARILKELDTRFGVKDEVREIGGTEFHHVAFRTSPASAPVGGAQLDAWMQLYARASNHVYWIERDGYLILADVPQTLMDYVAGKPGFDVGAWQAKAGLEVEHAVFAGMTRTRNAQRMVHAAYLGVLQTLGDLSGKPVDLYAFPSASALGLPADGTFAFALRAWDDGVALDMSYAQSPLEAFTGGSAMTTVAIAGVLAAIAIPAYNDYTVRAQVSEAMLGATGLKTALAEHVMANGKLPASARELGIELPIEFASSTATYEGGAIVIAFGDAAPTELQGLQVALVPFLAGDMVNFACGYAAMDEGGKALGEADGAALTTVPERYLPERCR